MRLEFQLNRFTKVHGICRFYLREIEPNIGLYLSPINFDPEMPILPISYLGGYSKELSRKIGLYHTLGMAEETWGLNEGRLTEEAYLEGCNEVLKETEEMLMLELDNFKEGLLVCVFGTPDRIQHMFWMEYEDNDPEYKGVIPEHYKKLDEILGRVLKKSGNDAVIIVLSDHGFGSFRKAVHLNRWLAENKFMDVNKTGEFFEGVSWEDTKAYAVGFNTGYRASWQTALGGAPDRIIEENKKRWSGDHCFDPSLVPGVLFCNSKLFPHPNPLPQGERENPCITDIAPTILKMFGIDIPAEMSGHPFIESPYSKEDEETTRSRLAGLGYIE